ncbi:MAG: DUF3883 domain-containing protein [bacterium]|nr:DUF3883 domain-containing protein [bacterium]
MSPEVKEILKLDISELKDFVETRQRFLSDKYNMISEFRGEKGINNDYKGRQLLELIQNADDAGSKFVNIIIDSESNKLQIINEGEPFSVAGFRSLMITNLSTKRKKKYIGNKGLGFRSILNWSQEVIISSGGCVVTFSVDHAKNKFFELYLNEDDRSEILKEFEYKEDIIPFPIFSLPSVKKSEDQQNHTTIEIDYYKEVETDILAQLKTLRKEVLLFLNHIEKIHISINGTITEYNSERINDTIAIDDQTWKVYNNKINGEDPLLPAKYRNLEVTEDESFSLKIAIQEGLKDNVNKLFTFFPTKIGLHFPMVIHGTFELDSSRNRIIETNKNKFLVTELINLIFKISDIFFGETANWDKLRLLNYKGNKDTVLEEFGFYTAIDNKIKTLPVLPCIDGNYRSYSHIKFHSSGFSELIEELEQQKHFSDLIQKIPDDILAYFKTQFPNYLTDKRYTDQILKSKAEAVSKEIYNTVSLDLYAKWIANLSYQFPKKGFYLSVLFNEQVAIIESNNTIFTPPSKNALVEVPAHIKMDYLNSNLYESLVRHYNISDDNERARKLKDKLEAFINIQSFEPAPVLTKIVTNTDKLISSTNKLSEKQGYAKAMLKSLYDYFNLSSRAKDSQIRTNNIPVINALGEIIYAKDSYLSKEYATGLLRTQLLGELYENKELVASGAELGLENEEEVEQFLIDFLGVNKYLQLERIEDRGISNDNYLNFVFKYKTKPDRFRSSRISYTQIKNISVIKDKIDKGDLTREQFVTWICVDNDISEKLRSFSDTDFRYDLTNQTYNSHNYRLQDVPSYIRYQLSSLGIFDGFLLNDMGTPIINDFQFDFKAETFQKRNIDSTLLKETLIQLGAKTEFNDLSIERVEEILKSLPTKDKLGKNARKIYQASIDRFKEKQEPLKNISDLLLHSTKEKVKQYIPYSEVYYANNIGLPRKILNEKAILNFPKRSGEQNISEFFSVQTFDNINYSAGDHTINEFSTSVLKAYLKDIRPYILVHRLQKLKADADIREAIRIVKSINIVLCDSLVYDFNGSSNEAEKYDFVPATDDKYTYLIKYSQSSSVDTLKQDSELSDVISEIYSIAFDLANIRAEIRSIFRNDTRDTQHQIIEEFGEENLLNAKSKLEITNGELEFWKIIYQLKKIPKKLPLVEDESDFRKIISSEFNINRKSISQIEYDFLDLKNNLKYLRDIFLHLNISLSDFNTSFGKSLNFHEYHEESLRLLVDNIKQDFIKALWSKYSVDAIEVQRTFTVQINSFNSAIVNAIAEECKLAIEVDYSIKITQTIKDKFDLVLSEESTKSISFIEQFEKNKKLIGLTDDQINLLEESDRSLLYFDIGEEELGKIKDKIKATSSNNDMPNNLPENKTEEPSDAKDISELEPRGKKKKPSKPRNRWGNSNPGGSYSPEEEKARKELGKKSEEEVLKALRDMYTEENVVWLSGYSNHPEKGDHWGFDMKYRVDKQSEWQFVEVKSFYNGAFYFTRTELEVATDDPSKYYLYLVSEHGISSVIFEKLLDENNELNYENEFFSIEIKDYKFTRI